MLVSFRSVVIAAKAVVLNLLSVAAAYGVLVLVFQHGWGKGLLGFEFTGGIDPFLPILLFVILFGLSMDYHVFILSRIREAYDRGMTTDEAISHGIKTTAGVVTSAAIVMVGVFAIFATLQAMILKQFGVGLAAAILIDATIVRAILLPATMKLLGDWNWYLPKWLEWLPHLEHGELRRAGRGAGRAVASSQAPSTRCGRSTHDCRSPKSASGIARTLVATGAPGSAASHRPALRWRGRRRCTSSTTTSCSPSRACRPATTWSAASCRSRSSRAPRSIYGRAPGGRTRDARALVGFFGVLAGTEAVYYTLAGGPVRRRLHGVPVAARPASCSSASGP